MTYQRGLDALGDMLEKAGHKYIRRWKNNKGEWEYEYPEGKIKGKPQQMVLPLEAKKEEPKPKASKEQMREHLKKKIGLLQERRSMIGAGIAAIQRMKNPSKGDQADLKSMANDLKQVTAELTRADDQLRQMGAGFKDGDRVRYQGQVGTVKGTRGDATMVEFDGSGTTAEAILTERLSPDAGTERKVGDFTVTATQEKSGKWTTKISGLPGGKTVEGGDGDTPEEALTRTERNIKAGKYDQAGVEVAAEPDKSTTTNGRGTVANSDGTFTALTFSQSQTFKTRKGAADWLAKRGFNPDGTRIKTPVTPEVEARMSGKLQQIGKEMQSEGFTEAMGTVLSRAEAVNTYNEANDLFNTAIEQSKKAKKKADKISILKAALPKVQALNEKLKGSQHNVTGRVVDLEHRINGLEGTSGKHANKLNATKDRAYRDMEMASDQMNYQPKQAVRLYNRAADGWDEVAKLHDARNEAPKAKEARDMAARNRENAKRAENYDPEKERRELAAKNRQRLVESGRAAPFHMVGGEFIERGVKKHGDTWIAINGDQVQVFDSETKANNAMQKMGYDSKGNPVSEAKTRSPVDEWQRRRNLPGVEVKHMTAGRASDVVLTLKGKVIGQKTTISTRGKDGEPSFLLPDMEEEGGKVIPFRKSLDGLEELGDVLEKAKYISRKKVGDRWYYTYPKEGGSHKAPALSFGDEAPTRRGAFKVSSTIRDWDELKDEQGRIAPDKAIFKEERAALDAIDRNDLPALFNEKNMADAQDAIARNTKQAFRTWMANVSKASPKVGRMLRGKSELAPIYFFSHMARVSGPDMANEAFKRTFETKSGHPGELQRKRLKKALDERVDLRKALPKSGVEGGSKTPPKEYREGGATKGKDYADPKNFKYPIDTESHVRAAISYFSKPKNAGVYSESQQASIWARIQKAAKKFGIAVSEKSGPPSVEEDGMEKSLYNIGFADRMAGTPFEADALRAIKEQCAIQKARDEVYAKFRTTWQERQAMDPVDAAKKSKQQSQAMEAIDKKEDALRKVKDQIEMKYLDWRIAQAESAGEMRKALPSASADISPEKARQILHDGTVHGKPLTDQQRKFFGAIGGHLPAPGKKGKAMKKADDGKPGESLEETSVAELRNTYQDIKTRLEQKPDDKALQARYKAIGAELKRRGTDKGEGMIMRKSDGLDELGDMLSKANGDLSPGSDPDGLPKHDWQTLGHAKSSEVDGGSADGGELDGVGMTAGSSDSGPGPGQNAQGQLTGVPAPKGEKFSEDDAEDEAQMKPHQKALERSLQKSITPANQREAVAHANAVAVSRLQKGMPDVRIGEAHPYSMDVVHGDMDKVAAGLVEDSFYHGRPPTLAPDGSILRKSITCSCGHEHPAMLTACPACSAGTTANRLLPHGGWVGQPSTVLEKSQPLLRKPPEEPDLYLPGVVESEE